MDILIVIVLALLFASILAGPVGWRHGRSKSAAGAWMFALLVMLPLLWLALLWVPAVGPAMVGVHWIGPTMVGVLLVLLIAAAAPPPRRLRPGEEPKAGQDQLAAEGPAAIFMDVMLWLFLIGAIGLLFVGLLG